MSSHRAIPSEPCAAQAKLMKRLGWESQETSDSLTAVWQLSIYTIELPAAFSPLNEAELLRHILGQVTAAGAENARRQMRQALGIS